jgi:hypothetical protein
METIEKQEPTAPKKRGRPPGTKNKRPYKRTVKRKVVAKKAVVSQDAIQAQVDLRTQHLETIIADLRHQIIGFQAVISYLENQLGLKKSL